MSYLISPLDLQRIFVVDVAGSIEVFSFLAILLISFVMGKYNFSNRISLVLFALFGTIMAAYMPGIYVLIILLAGFATFYAISKMSR